MQSAPIMFSVCLYTDNKFLEKQVGDLTSRKSKLDSKCICTAPLHNLNFNESVLFNIRGYAFYIKMTSKLFHTQFFIY